MSLAIEYRPIDSLIPYANNARTHSQAQVEQLVGSIKEFGFTNPILIDGANGVIAGHGRIMAARVLGMDALPCVELAGLTEVQKRAYILADNKLALNAGWDAEMLSYELDELRDAGFDISLLGFEAAELNDLIGTPNAGPEPTGDLSARFMIPPFSVFNAREGWWQARKRAWLALGIQSEIGRGDNALDMSASIMNASPGGSPRPAADYSKRQRGDGAGRAIEKGAVVAGNGWGNGGPARRDAAFYTKKRAWEKANDRKITTTEFREQYWDGAERPIDA